MFVHVSANGHEWGFVVPNDCIPAVGDEIILWYAMPDTESEEFVVGVVVRRRWSIVSSDDIHVRLCAKLNRRIPKGYISDSPVWPSINESQRKAEYAEKSAEIR